MDNLTSRQAKVLVAVTRHYIKTGRPVGSKYLCNYENFRLAPSTIRNELAQLEKLGYLNHPHTSAGRVPTDRGYRFYADSSLKNDNDSYDPEILNSSQLEGEVESALRETAVLLARATGLMALASAPSREGSAIKHVEVLDLQPDVVMVVIITASGGVSKKLFVFEEPVDTGLIKWARGYLNEVVSGLGLGSRLLLHRLREAKLSGSEKVFIGAISQAFEGPVEDTSRGLVMEGASQLLSSLEEGDYPTHDLMSVMDRQDEMLKMLRSALEEFKVYLRIGREIPAAAMQNCTLVAANYGVGHRNLGAVGVLGPTRMDYPLVIGNVEQAARSLSRLVGEIY